MIEMRFRCIAKSSSESEDGVVTWTIRFRRVISSGNGIELSGKIKTTSRERADSYVEGQEYLFKFPQDNELGGVFAASERQAGQDQEETPEQAEARFADYAARVARDMHEKDPGLPL